MIDRSELERAVAAWATAEANYLSAYRAWETMQGSKDEVRIGWEHGVVAAMQELTAAKVRMEAAARALVEAPSTSVADDADPVLCVVDLVLERAAEHAREAFRGARVIGDSWPAWLAAAKAAIVVDRDSRQPFGPIPLPLKDDVASLKEKVEYIAASVDSDLNLFLDRFSDLERRIGRLEGR